mgnify:CR=1 FL=1
MRRKIFAVLLVLATLFCGCSRNATEHCKVHKILLDVQQTYDNLLKGIKVSEIIKPDTDELSE